MLCHGMPCHTMLCYTIPYHTMLCHATLYYSMLCYAMLCPPPRCPLNHPICNPTASPSTQNQKQIIYNSHKKQVYNAFQQRPIMLSKCTPKCLKIAPQKLKKCTPDLPWDPPRDHSRKKLPNYALEGAPREPKMLPKITQRSA